MPGFACINCRREIDPEFKLCPFCGEPITDFLRKYEQEPIDGKYQILARLGVGGMGEVYKVMHTYLNSVRVVKLMRPQISNSADAHDRFLREARVASRVQHPNVATLHDFSGLEDGSNYMVWEFIDGENLAQLTRRYGQLSPRHAVEIAIQALHGLDAIHRAGIVHRDISPENLMITRDNQGAEQVKIIDLGVAKIGADAGEGQTQSGMFLGKFRYSSPEHLGFLEEGQHIDGRADLYSLAIVIYEMLVGRPPFEAKSPHEYMLIHSGSRPFLPLSLPEDLPGGNDLVAVLTKALDHDRNKRYQSAREFADALAALLPSLPASDDSAGMIEIRGSDPPVAEPTQRTPSPGTANIRTGTQRSSAAGRISATTPQPPRSTSSQRISSSEAATMLTPAPAPVPSVTRNTLNDSNTPTLLTPAPSQIPTPVLPPVVSPPSNKLTFALIAVIAVLLVAFAGYFIVSRQPRKEIAATATVPPATTGQPARRTIDVVSPPPVVVDTATLITTTATTAPTLSSTIATTPPIRTKPAKAKPPAPKEEQPAQAEEPPKAASADSGSSAHLWVEGGDSDANDRVALEARAQLRGVTRLAIRGGDAAMNKQLADFVKGNLSGVAVVDASEHPDVIVAFNAKVERLGFGKKRRSAEAVIHRGGHAVMRYEMKPQEYRVGDTPAEAFGRVLSEIVNQ